MIDFQKIIEQIRPEVERDLKKIREKVDHTAVCIGIVVTGFFVFFLLISKPPPPLFSIFYLILGIIAYFGLREHFLKLVSPLVEQRLQRLDREPETAEEFAERAEIFAEYGQPDAAVADYRSAIELAPDDKAILHDFALLLWKLERSDEALEFLEEITPISSDWQASAFFLRGRILEARDPIQAEKSFHKALEIDPDSVEFHLGRAGFYLRCERFDEVQADLDAASTLLRHVGLSDTGELCQLRGRLKMKQGDPAGAVKDFTRAVRVDPANASNYFLQRAQAWDALGDFRQARADRLHSEEK